MHNLVIFTASYIVDLDRLEILKLSVDKFNADKIPFYIVVPQKDLEIIKNKIATGNESYELKLITDEEVLISQGEQADGWKKQQVKKLAFVDLGLCNFYTIIDSDVYFIQDFHVSDFMRDENTPYLSMKEVYSINRTNLLRKIILTEQAKIISFVSIRVRYFPNSFLKI